MNVKYEDVPNYGKGTVKKLMDKQLLIGDENGNLNLNESMVRLFIVNDRVGIYDK